MEIARLSIFGLVAFWRGQQKVKADKAGPGARQGRQLGRTAADTVRLTGENTGMTFIREANQSDLMSY